jgi:cytochrome c oxidase assembly factor CtaG
VLAKQLESAPLFTWSIGVSAMIICHMPASHQLLETLERDLPGTGIGMVAAGMIFWWPLIVPRFEARIAPLSAAFYLFSACLVTTVIGIMIVFAPPGLYPEYLTPPDPLAVLHALRDDWGLSPAVDQQIGGLIIWVPCCLVYLTAILATLVRWYGAPEDEDGLSSFPIFPESIR